MADAHFLVARRRHVLQVETGEVVVLMRILLWLVAGTGLGLVIHLVVILSMPALAPDSIWSRIAEMDAFGKILVLDDVKPLEANPLQLDPELVYAVCRLSLSTGPGVIKASLPDAFWSVAVFDASGRAVYGTTNRSGAGQELQLGVFNQDQTRLLAKQQLDISEGLVIVEAEMNDVFVVVRLAPGYPALRQRYKEQLAKVSCANA